MTFSGLLLICDLLLIATMTVGTGFFVASEFALVNLDRNDLEGRERAGEARLGPTIRALRITSTHLSGAQLGITLTTLLTGFTFEPAVSRLLGGPLAAVGVGSSAVPVVGAVVGIGLATFLSMVIGELVPKNFALSHPLGTARAVVSAQIVANLVLLALGIRLVTAAVQWSRRSRGDDG